MGKAGLDPALLEAELFKLETVSSPLRIRPLIRFEDSFTLSMMSKEPQLLKLSGLTLNLMEIQGNDKNFSAALLQGNMIEGKITYDPSWFANARVLNHPYGSDILDHPWNPTIFISQGAGKFSVLDVKLFRRQGYGALRKFLSYRIDEPKAEEK